MRRRRNDRVSVIDRTIQTIDGNGGVAHAQGAADDVIIGNRRTHRLRGEGTSRILGVDEECRRIKGEGENVKIARCKDR
jgi:hypothetical protein